MFLTLATLGVLGILLLNLAVNGLARIDWQFLTSFPSRRAADAGILSAWVGTLLLMVVTAAVAIPFGIAAGIYLEEYAAKNKWTDFVEINIANLAGVPSILYGLMALGLFVYQFKFGQSILSGGLALACLVLPIVIVATRESLRSIPSTIREAAFALGGREVGSGVAGGVSGGVFRVGGGLCAGDLASGGGDHDRGHCGRPPAQDDHQPVGFGGDGDGVHRAGEFGRPAPRQHRPPVDLCGGGGAVRPDAGFQPSGACPEKEVPPCLLKRDSRRWKDGRIAGAELTVGSGGWACS